MKYETTLIQHTIASANALRLSLVTAMASICLASAGMADTYSVNSEASLRSAINNANANPGSTINFTAAGATIVLSSPLPEINASVTINGNGSFLSGANAHRVFVVGGNPVVINNLTIMNGRARGGDGGQGDNGAGLGGGGGGGGGAGMGGGLLIRSGAGARLRDVVFTANQAVGGNGANSDIVHPWGVTNAGGGGGSATGNGTRGLGAAIAGTGGGPSSYSGRGGNGGSLFTGFPGEAGGFGAGGGGGGYGDLPYGIHVETGRGGFGGGGGGGSNYRYDASLTRILGGKGGFGGGAGLDGKEYAWSVGTDSSGKENYIYFHGGGAGGGGGGFGGAVFVVYGGSLILESGRLNGNTGAAGAGGAARKSGPYDAWLTRQGAAGGFYGSGIFLNGGGILQFAPPAGKVFEISDGIADQNGNGGASFPNGHDGTGGDWSVTHRGAGTTILSGANSYAGWTGLFDGVLELGSVPALGSTAGLRFYGGTLRHTWGNYVDYSSIIKGSTHPIRIETNGPNITYAAALDNTNTGGLQKLGSGLLTLRAANTYTGFTTVSAGTLVAEIPASLPGGPVSLLTGGTLDLPFTGTTTASELYVDGNLYPGGTWGSLTSTAINKTALITGTGMLNVLGNRPRLVAEQPANVPVSGGIGYLISGNPETRTFTLRNTGLSFLVIDSVSVIDGDAANFSVNTSGMVGPNEAFLPGTSTTFTVTFSPPNNARSNTTLRIISTDPDFPVYDIALNGNVPETVPPTISAGPVYVSTNSSVGANAHYPPAVVADNSGATPTVMYSIPSGSFFPLGTTTVTATATDASGNTASTTFTVLVQAPRVANDVGGSFGPHNLAPAGTAFAKDVIGTAPHAIANVNDGVYGNHSSWIGASDDTFVGVSFGATPTAVKSIAWSRDNTGALTDRTTGVYVMQATTVPNPNAATPEASWTTMGIVSSFGELANPHQRHRYNFTPFLATGIRLKTLVPPGGQRMAIDELEVYQAGLATFGAGVYPAGEGGSFAPENLAAGKTAFAKDSFGAPFLSDRLNDLVYGELHSWAAGTADSFVGVNLGATPVSINRVAFGRDNTGTLSDRVFGLYTLQYTTVPNPDETTADASWTTLGTVHYNHDEPGFSYPDQRHEFSFPRVMATGFRLKTLAAGAPIAIDELELYGTPGIVLTDLWLTDEGGSADTARNLATGKTAFAKDEIGLAPHAILQINDGLYGNSKSWIGGTADTFIGIDLGQSRVIDRVAFGRDNANSAAQFTYRDRTAGTYIFQYTTVANPNAATPDVSWTTIGSAQFSSGGEPNFTNPALRHEFTFAGVAATGFRIKVQPTFPNFDGLIAIDELEIYAPYELNGGNIALVAEYGSIQPNNLASGKTAFAKDMVNVIPQAIAKVNDGLYGNANSWVAGSGDSFVGINLGAQPIAVDRVAFGRGNQDVFFDRVYGLYTLQYTTIPNPAAATADANWTTIGTIRYNNPGGPNFGGPRHRHEFTFDRVEATGFRIKTLASTSGDIAIDELELYGPSGVETTGGISLIAQGGTFLPNNLAVGKTTFAQNEIGVAPHTTSGVNDGLYGNANSWIAGGGESSIGINLGSPTAIDRIAFGRDNTGTLPDRFKGTYTLQYISPNDPNTWVSLGSITYKFAAYDLTAPGHRHKFTFTPVVATAFRLVISAAEFGPDGYIGIDELELYGPTLTAQELWRLQYFGSILNDGNGADSGDADNDGLTNLVEYAFGLNPTQPASAQLPEPVISGSAITYMFTQPAGVSGITYRAEKSSDLVNWTPIPDTASGQEHAFTLTPGTETRVLTRLVVTSP